MSETLSPLDPIPAGPNLRAAELAADGMLCILAAGIVGVAGASLRGKSADPALVHHKQDLQGQANHLRANINKEQAALGLLHGTMPDNDSPMVSLRQHIAGDQAHVQALTKEANALHAEATPDLTGGAIGGGIGLLAAAVFVGVRRTMAKRREQTS
jgi:hypothetical protein